MGAAESAGSRAEGSYDVAIIGGGLAGLTLALQLKKVRPDASIFVAERHAFPVREAAFKVGESTVELSCRYFGEVVGMKDHMEKDQIHKCGLRFFFTAGRNDDLAQRVELGPPLYPPVPSYQLDRGRFENELARRNKDAGIDLHDGWRAIEVDLDADPHRVTISDGEQEKTVSARWVVDASGRAFTLKKKLGLLQDNGHDVNSAWFRLAGGLDIEQWVDPDDNEWFGRMTERGLRRFSTNHLCGEGYWVWLIPLSSGPISIGIVADGSIHPFEEMSTLGGALDWIREHEPQLGAALEGRRDEIEDFLKVQNFSYGCERAFDGSKRWTLVGEAGAFLDPFYSPGSDYIAMANTLTTDLITRDLDGEDVGDRAEKHNEFYLSAYRTHLAFYEGQYGFWGNPQVMAAKVASNNILYWGANALLFFHDKIADVDFMARVRPDVDRIWTLNTRLEALYREWHEHDPREWHRGYVGVTSFPALIQRHVELVGGFDDDTLAAKLAENADLLEAMAVLIFHKATASLDGVSVGEDERIDPYAVSLRPDSWDADGLRGGERGMSLAEARKTPASGLETNWMDVVAEPADPSGVTA